MVTWSLPPKATGSRFAQTVELRPGRMGLFLPPEGPMLVGRSSDGFWRFVGWLSLTAADEFVIFRSETRPWDDVVRPLTADVLRSLPLSRWLVEAHGTFTEPIAAWLRAHGQDARAVDKAELRAMARRVAGSRPPRPGPSGFGDDYYRRLAISYLELQRQGIGRGIRPLLAEQESRRLGREVTPVQIRDALSKATTLGYLAPGKQGRAGRFPGPRLFEEKED